MIPIKSAREADKMREACRTASDILDRVRELVRPGITTKEVDEAAADFMEEAKVLSNVGRNFGGQGAAPKRKKNPKTPNYGGRGGGQNHNPDITWQLEP